VSTPERLFPNGRFAGQPNLAVSATMTVCSHGETPHRGDRPREDPAWILPTEAQLNSNPEKSFTDVALVHSEGGVLSSHRSAIPANHSDNRHRHSVACPPVGSTEREKSQCL